MTPLAEYRVYPDRRKESPKWRRRLFYRVVWFKRVTELRQLFGKRRSRPVGFARTWAHVQDNGECGIIALCKRWQGSGTTSHEATHAALGFLCFRKDGSRRDELRWNEERFCYTVGSIARGIVQGAYKRGVY